MAYTADMVAAAERLSAAANQLAKQSDTKGVAAYLFGLAAECALKAIAAKLNLSPGDIQWMHLPDLRHALRRALQGRRAVPLKRLVDSDSFLNEWAIGIRYARNSELRDKPLDRWRDQAAKAITLMKGWD